MIYGFTGHRPDKLGGYSREAKQKLYNFAHQVVRVHLDPEYTYSHGQNNSAIIGMAQGWDMTVAQACYALGVPYTAAVPYYGQESIWPDEDTKTLYRCLLESAEKVIYVSETTGGNASAALQLRNRWIVDHSERMIALWNGQRGGTYNCVKYAGTVNRDVKNVWEEWERFQNAL